MAAPVIAVVAKKAAAILLTDKRAWTVIGSVVTGIFVFVILTVTVLFGGLSAHHSAEKEGKAAVNSALDALFSSGELSEDMPAEYRDGISKIREVFGDVEKALGEHAPEADPVKAQVILIWLLWERADQENFYNDFAVCFAGAENDSQIFDRISEIFQIEISPDERGKILSLYQNSVDSAQGSSA